MLTYWLMYLFPAFIALYLPRKQQSAIGLWLLFGFIFVLLIGFREHVGGDWGNYLRHYHAVIGRPLEEILNFKEPGHQLLNWLAAKYNLGVYATNIVYGFIFMIGLIKLIRNEPYPWIAATVAVPYLIIVVAMGYSRQAVAIGFFMIGISNLKKGKFKTYLSYVIMAAMFHKTAVLLIPLGVFVHGKGKLLKILMILPIVYGVWDLILADQQEKLWKNYVEAQMQSTGAQIRVFMTFVASLFFFNYRKEWKQNFNDYTFWYWVSVLSLISMIAVNFASTAVDRIALYFIPLQLIVYARLPFLARKKINPSIVKILIVLGYALVLFVWLTFGTFSMWWLPYNNLLVKGLY